LLAHTAHVCYFYFVESEDSVLADLRWLGLLWDEGPDMVGLEYGPYRQSERSEFYFAAAQRLLQQGKAYRCFSSAQELEETKQAQEAAGETPRYDGRWRDADPALVNKMMAEGIPYTIRFKVPENSRIVIDDVVRGTVGWDAEATVGDFILLRSSGVPVYNFCVAVDDASMGITTVVRAEEHLTNTLRQALILDALGAPRPRYAHCSLILGEDKQKLSKRHGATSCDQYRLDGFLPDAMINYLALLGWNDGTENEIFLRDDLIDAFELGRVVKSPSVFDIEKLKWVNSQHMKQLSVEDLVPMVKDQMVLENMLKEGASLDDPGFTDFSTAATALAKQMMETTKDAALNAKAVLNYGLPATFGELVDLDAKTMIEMGNFYPLAMKIVEQYDAGIFPQPSEENTLSTFQDATGSAIEEDAVKGVLCTYTQDYIANMKSLAKEMGVKGKCLFHPVRLALTGEMSGQDVTKQLSLLTMASGKGSVIDAEKVGMVDFAARLAHLKSFCESIPEEFRSAEKVGTKDGGKKGQEASKTAGTEKQHTPTTATSSGSGSDPMDSYEGPPITALDIRVGRIIRVWEHPEADKLYCEEIDVGEDEPRQVASGLREFMKPEDMEGRMVLVLCNLKERKLVGFPSHGMVLCASNADHTQVKLVSAPVEAKVGERVTVPDMDFEGEESAPFAENKIGKKKVFEKLAPFLVTSKYGVPEFLGRPLMTSAGVCTSPISEGSVS
jgi:glutamyl-tRNA synthetase